MKKTFTLILLGGLLFFGVGFANGASRTFDGKEKLYFNVGAVNWWNDGGVTHFLKFDDATYAPVAVFASGCYYYVIPPAGTYSTVKLERHPSDATDEARGGAYNTTGAISLDASKDCITSFAENSTSASWGTMRQYTISYYNNYSWSNVYLYAWTGSVNHCGNHPGTKVTADANGLYTITFIASDVPDNIQWNIGGNSDKTGNLTFEDGAVYDYFGIIPTSITLSDVDGFANGFATFCGAYKFTISGATAYRAALGSSVLTLTALSGIIPAGDGIILAGEPGATATISYTTSSATATMTGNLLSGTTTRTLVSDLKGGATYLYALDKTDNVFKVYGGEGVYLPANKAYFTSNSQLAPGYRIIDMPTDINSIEAVEEGVKFIQNGKLYIKKNNVVYNMTGAIVK